MKKEWNDYINAMTMKELRQDINSNWVKFGSLVLAVGLVYGAMMLFKGDMTMKGFQMSFMETVFSGKTMFYLGTGVMAVGCLGFGGCLEMFRFSRERSVADLDVGNFTSMSPLRMAWGRFLSGLIMSLYVYSICLPCVVSAYYLQGITVSSIVMTHLYVMILVIALNLAMLWVGSLGKQSSLGAFLVLSAMIGVIICGPYCYLLFTADFADPTLLAIESVGLLAGGMFFLFTVCELSAPLSNRLMPVRIYLVIACLASLLLGFCLKENDSGNDGGTTSQWICLAASTVFAFLVTVFGANTVFDISIRVRENCPRNIVLRVLYFLFSSVWGGGYILSFLMVCIVWFSTARWQPEMLESNGFFPELNMLGYMMFYISISYLLQTFIKRISAGTLVMLVGVIFNLVPFMVWFGVFLLNQGDDGAGFAGEEFWKTVMFTSAIRYLPDIIDGLQFNTWKDYAANLIGIWLCLVGFVAVLPLVVKQFIGFHKPTEEEWKQLLTPQEKKS